MVPKESAAAMQGIFNVEDLFLSSERFKMQQKFNCNHQNHVLKFHQIRNIGVVPPHNLSLFPKIEKLKEDDKFKALNTRDFNIIQLKETNHCGVSQNSNSIKSCISRSTLASLGNYLSNH